MRLRNRGNDEQVVIDDDHAWWAERDDLALKPRRWTNREVIADLQLIDVTDTGWRDGVDRPGVLVAGRNGVSWIQLTFDLGLAPLVAAIDLVDRDDNAVFDVDALFVDLANALRWEQLALFSETSGGWGPRPERSVEEPPLLDDHCGDTGIRGDAWFLSR